MRHALLLIVLVLLLAPAAGRAQDLGAPLTDEPPVPLGQPEPDPEPEREHEPEPDPGPGPGTGLPDTGAPAAVLALLGAGLVATGASVRVHLRLLGD